MSHSHIVHLVNPFANALGGSEQRAIALYKELKGRCDVYLWSEYKHDIRLSNYPIQRINSDQGIGPRSGVLVIVGNYFPIGTWLPSARPQRAVLIANTFIFEQFKYSTWQALQRIAQPEIVYASRLISDWMGIPGPLQTSLIDIARFAPVPRAESAAFVIGRLSRDVPEKHHPLDPELYRTLVQQGCRVRIMGGKCLAPQIGGMDGIELLEAGAELADAFLQNLDCFFYRTSDAWLEAGGRVVAEAMACGLPIVCHRRGGYSEWIYHGENGLLFETQEDALELLLRLKKDVGLRRSLGDAARKTVELLFSSEAREQVVQYYLSDLPSVPKTAN